MKFLVDIVDTASSCGGLRRQYINDGNRYPPNKDYGPISVVSTCGHTHLVQI